MIHIHKHLYISDFIYNISFIIYPFYKYKKKLIFIIFYVTYYFVISSLGPIGFFYSSK